MVAAATDRSRHRDAQPWHPRGPRVRGVASGRPRRPAAGRRDSGGQRPRPGDCAAARHQCHRRA
eukprot:1702335-Pyramimonas_sp.AAC.2